MELRVPKESATRAPQLVMSPTSKTNSSGMAAVKVNVKESTESYKLKKKEKEVDQQNDAEQENEEDDDVDQGSDDSNDDAQSYTSNQTEDGDEDNDPEGMDDDDDDDSDDSEKQENDLEDIQQAKTNDRSNKQQSPTPIVGGANKQQPTPTISSKSELPLLSPALRPLNMTKHLPAVLSLPIADPKKKGIQEPRPPRGSSATVPGATSTSNNNSNSSGGPQLSLSHTNKSEANKKARAKFQFPDAELLNLVLEEEDKAGSSSASPSTTTRASGGIANANAQQQQRRRYSSTAAVMGTTLPLRRKSFSLTKSPAKKLLPPLSPSSFSPSLFAVSDALAKPTSRFQARRKSTSACYSLRSGAKSPLYTMNKNLVSSLPPLVPSYSHAAAAAAAAANGDNAAPLPTSATSSSSSSSSMVLRVRRTHDGTPELVISKRPSRVLVWNWNDRQIRIPSMIQLGPHQHSIMLRQLRYVKSVMNDFPWAKTHLKDLLASYTKKDTSKEQLYPQLNQLSHQVQQEMGTQVKKQKQLIVKKQRLTMQLSLATGVLNEMQVTKYGRRGKPHETKLYYDPGQPTKLHWIRKNGDRSIEFLDVDAVEIHCYGADSDENELSAGMKKALKKFTQTAALENALSLVTPQRTLDLQMKSSMHREWLINALSDVVSFARQYRAAGMRRENQQHAAHVLRRM